MNRIREVVARFIAWELLSWVENRGHRKLWIAINLITLGSLYWGIVAGLGIALGFASDLYKGKGDSR